MSDTMSFRTDDAKKYGLKEAVILRNLRFWIKKNKANDKHFHEGRYWTYNSVTAFKKLFDFLTHKQIRGALDNLRKAGIVEAKNLNDDKRNSTLWYTVLDNEGCPDGHPRVPKKASPPYTDINPDIKHPSSWGSKEVISYLNQKTNKKYLSSAIANQKPIKARIAEGYTLEDFKRVIDLKSEEWKNTSFEKYLRPITLFGSKFDGYLNEGGSTKKEIVGEWEAWAATAEQGDLL